ncbi:MAG: copper chaperone CopZ [Lacrimispora celerecrescens]|uniref:copper chaperone CopZ n=1 Tax=Lacrimispora indolis TaxID=69825 RepID=UPI00041ABBC6|nr:copper chaperone CopZ [[Clostridium] methoxybenzovorans]MBE7720577.1 copper chaperone CopZ [Lacrimispora celerecrescens]
MAKAVIKVDGMSCEHCVKAITNAVGAISGVSGVSVDLEGKTVTVDHDPDQASVQTIKSEIEDQGYDVVE